MTALPSSTTVNVNTRPVAERTVRLLTIPTRSGLTYSTAPAGVTSQFSASPEAVSTTDSPSGSTIAVTVRTRVQIRTGCVSLACTVRIGVRPSSTPAPPKTRRPVIGLPGLRRHPGRERGSQAQHQHRRHDRLGPRHATTSFAPVSPSSTPAARRMRAPSRPHRATAFSRRTASTGSDV